MPTKSSVFRLTTTIRRRASSTTAALWQRRRKSVSPAQKQDAAFRRTRLITALREAGITTSQLDARRLLRKAARQIRAPARDDTACAPRGLSAYLTACPFGSARSSGWPTRLPTRWTVTSGEILFGNHHESHAASAFYPSPFEHAAVVTMDGVGEWATSTNGVGPGTGDRDLARAPISAFAGAALFGVHLLRRVSREFWRIQGDGPGTGRRAQDSSRPSKTTSSRS